MTALAFVHDALPGRIVFGEGAIDRIADEVTGLGEPRRVLVIASGSAKAAGDRVADALGQRFVRAFGDVRQHVPEDLVAVARSAASDIGADAVVTVGGGSAIGLGKAVAVHLDVLLAAVPTTCSGSEMTPIYGITSAENQKTTARDRRALPRLVVYDPTLTVTMPPVLTATSGFNALAHCVEALYGPGASPMTVLWAEEGIRRLAASLPTAVSAPADLEARGEALYGAYLAGASLAVAGTALHHKLCHVLGGRFGLDHAGVHTVLLPHVAAFNAEAAPAALSQVAADLGGPAEAAAAGGLLHDLAARLGAPASLAELGMPAEGIDQAAAQAVTTVGTGNPRPVDEASLRQLLRAAYEGRRP